MTRKQIEILGAVKDKNSHIPSGMIMEFRDIMPSCFSSLILDRCKSMRKVVYTLFLVLCLPSVVNAQTIRDTNNSVVAKVDTDGTVRNTNNSVVARINNNGDIRDGNYHLLGKIESDGTIKDPNNHILGKVDINGTVRNRNNSVLGKIESDGTVRDGNNHILGYARGVPQRFAAVFFFFQSFYSPR